MTAPKDVEKELEGWGVSSFCFISRQKPKNNSENGDGNHATAPKRWENGTPSSFLNALPLPPVISGADSSSSSSEMLQMCDLELLTSRRSILPYLSSEANRLGYGCEERQYGIRGEHDGQNAE
uniref:Uncharacterized protein n=1 Tax=Pristionchus pacificus TaxID=54126 RepID=A0A2A6B5I5_PRIPA|eukprot:PDM61137.1 hypothetical protein PRIPAC_50579 [Pristionchus pacificus]